MVWGALADLVSTDEGPLHRELGLLEATAIGLGTMIGGGIFILPSIAAHQAGPASAISFLIAGGITLFSALSMSELATARPRAGGAYVYVRDALGPFFGTVVGLSMWAGMVFATAFYVVGFAQYLFFFHDAVPVVAVAAALTIALTGVNYWGASETGFVEDVLVYSLVVLIVGFVAASLPSVEAQSWSPFAPEGWGAVASTTGTVYVTFIGFQVTATAAGEVKDPDRNLPLAMVLSVIVPTVLYVGVMLVATGTVPLEELATSGMPVATVALVTIGGFGGVMMTVGALMATVSSANASILSAGRVSFAMGPSVLTEWLGRVHEEHHTPSRALLATGVGIVGLVALNLGLALLAEVAGFVFLFAYALSNLAVIEFRRGDHAYDPGFRLPRVAYPAVPIIGFVASVAIMTQMSLPAILGGTLLLLLAGAWHVAYARREQD